MIKAQNLNLRTQNHNLKLKSNLRQRSYGFSLEIIHFVNQLPSRKIYWTISDQLLRSATSVGANIIEAKASSSKRDFIKFYEIALKSANETKYWLLLLNESGLVKNRTIEHLIKEAEELGRMLGSSLLTMKGKKIYSQF